MSARSPRWLAKAAGSGLAVWIVVLVMFLVAFVFAGGFGTPENLNSVSRQGVAIAVLALAEFLVVLTGEVDLSIAANARLVAIVTAIVMSGDDSNDVLAIVIALAIGLGVGALNALLVVVFKVESFIATLGVSAIVQGIALFVAPTPKGRSSPGLHDFYAAQLPGGVFVVVLVVAALWVIAWFLLRRTVWGRRVFATGGNAGIAALSGVGIRGVRTSAFLVSGALGAFAGLLVLASSGVGDPSAASGMEFTALAIVVIGGASLEGGRGRLIGVLGGVVLFALIGNVFNLLRIEVWYQQLVRGVIILVAAAAFVERIGDRRRRTPSRPSAGASTSKRSTEGEPQWP